MTPQHVAEWTEKQDFPTVRWGDYSVTFEPVIEPIEPKDGPAVVVFLRTKGGYVLANVRDRGWCTPSGRLEEGETHQEAAIRETYEEAGARLERLSEFGRYVLRSDDGRIMKFPAYVGRTAAFGEIPPESESDGAKCVPFEELGNVYYRWDDLLDTVFGYVEQLTYNDSE